MWVVDSTPVECARSWDAVMRSDRAGWAQYGYCAMHSRYFWGLRLHLVCALSGLPVAFALAGAKAGEQETLLDIFTAERARPSNRSTRRSKASWTWNATAGTPATGWPSRVLQRILALTAVIWHNDKIGAPIKRSLIAYDH